MDSTLSRRDQGLIRGGAKIFPLRRLVLSSRRTGLAPIGASPRGWAQRPHAPARNSPQNWRLSVSTTDCLVICSRVLRKATPLLVSGPLLLEKLAAFLILNSSERAKVWQDPGTSAGRWSRSRRPAPRRPTPNRHSRSSP